MNNLMQNMNNQQNMNQQQNMTPALAAMMQQQYFDAMNNQGQNINSNQQGSLVSKLFDNPTGSNKMQSTGTSIADLRKMQHVNKQRSAPPLRQVSAREQYKKQNIDIRSQGISDSDQERDKIKHLVKDINKSLDDYGPSKMRSTEDSDTDTDNDNNNSASEKEKTDEKYTKSNDENIILDYLKESILLIVVYVILSQNFVKKMIGTYIAQINPREDGSVSLIGYIAYGVILAIIFMFLKRAIIK